MEKTDYLEGEEVFQTIEDMFLEEGQPSLSKIEKKHLLAEGLETREEFESNGYEARLTYRVNGVDKVNVKFDVMKNYGNSEKTEMVTFIRTSRNRETFPPYFW